MSTKLNINQIMRYLPHRFPFLFLDAVDDVTPGESLLAYKNVSINEMPFLGHFPGNPVFPGVLQVEAMGQTAALLGLLSGAKLDSERSIYVTAITDCKFRKPVLPGHRLDLKAVIERHRLGMWRFACESFVDGELVSAARITATTAPKIQAPPLPEHLPPPPDLGF